MDTEDSFEWQPEDTADEDWGVVSWQPADSEQLTVAQETEELCEELICKLHFRTRADVCFLFHKIYCVASQGRLPTTEGIRAVIDWSVEDLNGYCDEVLGL